MIWILLLAHIIDDFFLQIPALSNMKQKGYWVKLVPEINKTKYKNDYMMALVIHGFSWSIIVHLLFILITPYDIAQLSLSIIIHAVVHLLVDHMKANLGWINLIQDQLIHMIQLGVIWIMFGGGL